ncbi:MAG: molybdopterin cofactor-binding domain-containing protein, partial [Pseudomonadota bacterium]
MTEYAVVGKGVPRIDGIPKVTGTATYAGDLILPGMIHGKLLRSPYAHANIAHIDTSKAEKLPGVRAVITGKDFPGKLVGFMKKYSDRPPLAVGKVRYVGEAVAAVAAEDEDTAEEALGLLSVEYEELPMVLTAEEAMREGAVLVHEGKRRNIAAESHFQFGDAEKGLRESDYIREETFTTQRISVGFIEPHAALASVDASGNVIFQGSKQSPYITLRHLSSGLDIPLNKIRIITPYIGGAFSGKHDAHDLDFAAVLLSQKTGRPVRIVVSQSEIIGSYRQRHAKEMWLKLGVKKDGTLVAADCRLIAEGGAYMGVGPLNIYILGTSLNLPYRLPNIRFEGYRIYTNKPICGAVRGQSNVVSRFVFESLLDMVADDIGVDRVEIRRKNAVYAGYITANGMHVDSCGLTECIERVTEKIGWKESRKKKRPYRGVGFACGSLPSGARLGGHFGAIALVNVLEDGTAVLHHGGTELGQGIDTIMGQMVAEVLGLHAQDVQVGIEDNTVSALAPGMFA